MSEMPIPEEVARFWSKVQRGDDCWNWAGGLIDGYGVCTAVGTSWRAHRLSWVIHFGAIPDGMVVCHACDNRACVRPDHLLLGTQRANVRDCSEKGRNNQIGRKFTAALVTEMRALYASGGITFEALASQYGTTLSHVHNLVTGKAWAEVPGAVSSKVDKGPRERCRNGHAYKEVGRTRNGRCAECHRQGKRERYRAMLASGMSPAEAKRRK
jgi:hypothetical protein